MPAEEARSRALDSLQKTRARDASAPGEKAAAERRQRELTNRLAEFANCWNKLAAMVEKGVWNTKQARKTREAFERLTRTEGWMEDAKIQASADGPH